ncbi:MAG: T9SS type A sorting domain-containing protein [bacterium]
MKKILLFSFLLIIAMSAFAQLDSVWTNYYTMQSASTFDGELEDYCYSVIENNSGEYVFAGFAEELLPTLDSIQPYEYINNMYLVSTDKDGNMLRERNYGQIVYDEECRDIIQTKDGGYLLGGIRSHWDSTAQHGIVYKLDSNYETIWTIQIDNQYIFKMEEMSDSSIILCMHGEIAKLDADSNILWRKTIQRPRDILELDNGDYLLAAGYGNLGDYAGYLHKFNADDSLLWSREYEMNSNYNEFGYIIQTPDSNFLLAGVDGSDLWLVKVDEAGDTLWTNVSFSLMWPSFFVRDNQGILYVTDSYNTLFMADSSGSLIDSMVYDFSRLRDMIQSSDGSFLLAGQTRMHGPGTQGNFYGVNIGDMMPSAFDIIPTADNYLSGSPTLNWHSSSSYDTIMYEITINTPVDTVSQADTSYTTTLSDGMYTWFVTAINSYDSTVQSASIDTFIMDNSAPLMLSMDTLPDTSYSGPFTLNFEVSDTLAGIDSMTLFYLLPESKVSWASTVPSHVSGSNYTAEIPAVAKKGIVYYYFEMADNARPSNTVRYPGGMELYSFEVTGLTGIESGNIQYSLNIKQIDNTSIEMTLPSESPVSIKVYDASGRMVTGRAMNMSAGKHKVNLNINPGVYFVRISSRFGDESRKMVRVR